MTSQSEVGTIETLIVKHARDAFEGPDIIAAQWKDLNYAGAPDFARAITEYDAFVELLRSTGCNIHLLPKAQGVGMDSIYVRDAAVICDRGAILCNMGKAQRTGEPVVMEAALRATLFKVKRISTIGSDGSM